MSTLLRHPWDIVNLLQERKSGLTFDQILKHFHQTPKRNTLHRRNPEPTAYAIFMLRNAIRSALEKLTKEDVIVLLDGVYKLNLDN